MTYLNAKSAIELLLKKHGIHENSRSNDDFDKAKKLFPLIEDVSYELFCKIVADYLKI